MKKVLDFIQFGGLGALVLRQRPLTRSPSDPRGRGIVRKALYLCACSVIEGELRRFYKNLRQRGKSDNVVLVAVMRKLLLQMNALACRGTPWVHSTG